MQSSLHIHEIIFSQTRNPNPLFSLSLQHTSPTMKIGDMSEPKQELDSRRPRPCLGDNNEAPPKKKQQKSEKPAFQGCNAAEDGGVVTTATVAEDTGRERLKRLRVEVAGRVWIPEIWGQEELLNDWIDCRGFDASLMNSNVMSAREALMQEGRRATSSRLRIENSC